MIAAAWALSAAFGLTPALGQDATSDEVQVAKTFFADAVKGNVPADLDMSITQNGANRRFSHGELSAILKQCGRRTVYTNPIFNRDGTVPPNLHYVTMNLECEGPSGVAVFEFRSGRLTRFLFQANKKTS